MFSKQFIIVCLVLAIIPTSTLCQDVNLESLMEYNRWRFNNKRVYLNEEEKIYRQQVFFESLKKVQNHNNNNNSTYQLGLNQFSDMSDEEFRQTMGNNYIGEQAAKANSKRIDGEEPQYFNPPRGSGYSAPQTVDWRTKGYVTFVKHQGTCGSCWTFSTVGVLETAYAIKTGKVPLFSEQQLLDCVTPQAGYDASGCRGGWPQSALLYTQRMGIVNSAHYSYTGVQGRCLVTQRTQNGYYIKGYNQIQPNNVEAMKNALQWGAISVLIDSNPLKDYRGGAFSGCGPTSSYQLNHAVTLVGYDIYGNWIIKNSYGPTWGEKGYLRLAPGNTCGVLLAGYIANP